MSLISTDICALLECLPFDITGDILEVAMPDPLDHGILNQLKRGGFLVFTRLGAVTWKSFRWKTLMISKEIKEP